MGAIAGEFTYEEQPDWARLPEGWSFREVIDVVVGAQDRVCVFQSGEHPLIALEADITFVSA